MGEIHVKNFIGELTKELTCSFCKDIFTLPKTLRCLHTFCLKCIVEWSEQCKRQRSHFACPTCAISIQTKDDDLSKLPSLYGFEPLLKLHQALTTKPNKQNQKLLPKCVGCSKRMALVSFCRQCSGMICNECVNAHKTLKTILGDHQTTMLIEFNQEHLNSYLRNQVTCQVKSHDNSTLEMFCQTCCKAVCHLCCEGSHSKHEKESIHNAVVNAKKVIKRDMNRVKPLMDGYIHDKTIYKENVARLEEEIIAAKKRVHSVVQEQIKALQDHEMTMMIVLDEMLQRELVSDDYEQNELDINIQQVAEYRHQCKVMGERKVSLKVLQSYPLLKDICKTLTEKSILSNKPVKKAVSLQYVPNVLAMESLQNLGHIQECVTDPSRCTIESMVNVRCGYINTFDIVTRTSEIIVCDTSEGLLEVTIQDGDGKKVEKDIKTTATGTFTVTYRATKPSPYRITVWIGCKEISNSPQIVETMDTKAEFKPVKIIGKDVPTRLHNSCSLALSNKGEIAVADTGNDRIVVFNSNWKFLREFGGDGDALYRPWGVVFNEDRILVSDNPENDGRIQEFDIKGTYLRTVYSQKGAEMLGMCATEKHFACLEDGEEARRIKVFDKRTGHLVRNIKVTSIEGNPPTFLAYNDGKYFIPFVDESCVKVFDENGTFLYNFGEKGSKDGQLNCAAGISSFGTDMLLVCDAGNDRVQVFSQEGQFVSSFGSRGSDLGLMKAPIHAVLAPQGQAMVLECNGSRIQIWR